MRNVSVSPWRVTRRGARCWVGAGGRGPCGCRSGATRRSVHVYEGAYELDRSADGGYTARISARGTSVLASPMINRGTAFTARERQELGLTGLLPSGVSTLDGQLRRTYAQYSAPSRRPGQERLPGEPAQPQRGAVLPAADRAPRGDAADRLHPDGRRGDRAVQPRVPPPARRVPVGRPPRPDRDRAAQHRAGRRRRRPDRRHRRRGHPRHRRLGRRRHRDRRRQARRLHRRRRDRPAPGHPGGRSTSAPTTWRC